MSCGIGCRCSSDLVLLWLWHRLAAVALIGSLAWEPPHATGVALKKKKMRMQVQSLASLSGLRIQRCRELWCSLQTQLGSHVAVALA